MSSDWLMGEGLKRLLARNQSQVLNFEPLISSYQTVVQQSRTLHKQNQALKHSEHEHSRTEQLHQLQHQLSIQSNLSQEFRQLENTHQETANQLAAVQKQANQQAEDLTFITAELTRTRAQRDAYQQQNLELKERVKQLEIQLLQKSEMLQELMLGESKSQNKEAEDDKEERTSSLRSDSSASLDINISCLPTKIRHKVKAHATEINSVTHSRDGSMLMTASGDGTIRRWDSQSAAARADFRGAGQPLMAVDISPDSELVLGASTDRSCRIWRVGTGRISHTLSGHSSKVYCGKFFTTSSHLLTGSYDRTLKLWDVSRGTCINTFSCRSACNDLHIRRGDDEAISCHNDGIIRLWDLRSKTHIMEIPTTSLEASLSQQQRVITSVRFRGKDMQIICNSRGDHTLKMIDLRRPDEMVAQLHHPQLRTFVNWSKIDVSANGKYVVIGSSNGKAFIWDLTNLDDLEPEILSDENSGNSSVVSCSWHPNGKTLVTCDKDGVFYMWE